jgi:hypothetical protein
MLNLSRIDDGVVMSRGVACGGDSGRFFGFNVQVLHQRDAGRDSGAAGNILAVAAIGLGGAY